MLAEMQPDIQEALDMGVSLFAGEAEERLDGVLRDAASGTLKPIYNYLADLPSIQSAPVPYLLRKHVKRTAGNYSTFDAGSAAAHTNARSAPSSMSRERNRGGARRTTSS